MGEAGPGLLPPCGSSVKVAVVGEEVNGAHFPTQVGCDAWTCLLLTHRGEVLGSISQRQEDWDLQEVALL